MLYSACVLANLFGGQQLLGVGSPAPMWNQDIELRLSGLCISNFTAESSC